MARKINLTMIIFILFLTRTIIYADDYKWDLVNALSRNNFQMVEKILAENINTMSIPDKRLAVNFVLTYSAVENTLKNMELSLKYNIHASQFDLYTSINRNHTNSVIQFMLKDGIQPNGEILLLSAES